MEPPSPESSPDSDGCTPVRMTDLFYDTEERITPSETDRSIRVTQTCILCSTLKQCTQLLFQFKVCFLAINVVSITYRSEHSIAVALLNLIFLRPDWILFPCVVAATLAGLVKDVLFTCK